MWYHWHLSQSIFAESKRFGIFSSNHQSKLRHWKWLNAFFHSIKSQIVGTYSMVAMLLCHGAAITRAMKWLHRLRRERAKRRKIRVEKSAMQEIHASMTLQRNILVPHSIHLVLLFRSFEYCALDVLKSQYIVYLAIFFLLCSLCCSFHSFSRSLHSS